MGPQLGFYYPRLSSRCTSAPGIEAQGVAVPGISMYLLIGRTENYAWSLTSANHDVRDVFAEVLCNPDGTDPSRESSHLRIQGRMPPLRDIRRGNAQRRTDPLPGIGTRPRDWHRDLQWPAHCAHSAGAPPSAAMA